MATAITFTDPNKAWDALFTWGYHAHAADCAIDRATFPVGSDTLVGIADECEAERDGGSSSDGDDDGGSSSGTIDPTDPESVYDDCIAEGNPAWICSLAEDAAEIGTDPRTIEERVKDFVDGGGEGGGGNGGDELADWLPEWFDDMPGPRIEGVPVLLIAVALLGLLVLTR